MLLSCAMDCGDPAVAELVQNISAEGACAKIIEGVLCEPAAQRAARVSVDAVERQAKAAAVRYVVPGDEEWPAGLADLRHAESIQRRGGEPLGLWLCGPGHLAHLMERSVAIVGSRAAMAYGNGIAADLAADLVERGVTVLSGGAMRH
jgi:DNA processing protein